MRIASLLSLCALLFVSVAQAHRNPPGHSHPPGHGDPPGQAKDETIALAQLHGPARILRDVDGMPHIYAFDEHDALFLQGWVQAQDRLFQIDVLRRQTSSFAPLVSRAARNGRWRRIQSRRLPACRPMPTA
jgi:acyl-homoserine lactone acylase PvdQ